MTKQRFETALQQLTARRREVLEHFLSGESDEAIAKSLVIADTTVRQHIRKICQVFGLKNDFEDDHSSQRANLMALFAQYKPDLLHKPTVTESQNQASDSIFSLNTSTSSRQDACTTEYDPNFVGRDDAIIALDNRINKGAKIIQIIAPGGTGKTRLAQKYLERRFKTVLEFPIGKEKKDIASIENLLEFNLRKLGEEPGKELIESLQRLKQELQDREIGILIDNLEPALDASGKFIEQNRSYVELLRVLTDSSVKSLTLITSRERLCESLYITLYSLPSLSVEAWSEYWHYQGINSDIPILTEIYKVYGGNALAMKVLCNPILNDFNGDIVAYWQENKTEENLEVETAVANLIREQFERLAYINTDAYNLLCRMGCYRYQDEYVSTIPEKGLFCLLWDVVKNQHKRIIKILKDRALFEFNNDEYSLHPVIRKEAIERLRNRQDWKQANTKAAEFWTESVKTIETVKDGSKALEAYYHYVEIKDFDKACSVILHRRPNQWEKPNKWESGSTLGSSLMKLGLISEINFAITNTINNIGKINRFYSESKLYSMLANICYRKGNIHESITFYQKSEKLSTQNLEHLISNSSCCSYNETIQKNFELKELKIDCMLNIVLCRIQLLEIKNALEISENIHSLFDDKSDDFMKRKIVVWFYLAYLYSCINCKDKALHFIKKVENNNLNDILDIWVRGLKLIFLGMAYKNLQEIEKAEKFYLNAISFSDETHSTLINGNALNALSEIYRQKQKFEIALIYHQESIAILDKIGAKCDLAEAYFQLALTYQKIGDKANSKQYFDKAMYLWSPEQIDAPKQIKRVLKAMNYES
ncbi:LuxR C-terminal-related transcriptional regulator [Trichormus sp. NMC-1]|uniref:LuxR C-terminal-related transcriptional regulator n=1 Tax=Trichormus sp. NMC-1 TaxID=1853259 RepID=UPI0008DBF505|nr:LuxR C-terminal-related transcriptional regulator [Trichormus sp. NMC-1]